jgi:carboxymethylenebutenolidase
VPRDAIATFFGARNYVFLVPHRRGHGRSTGPYIMDQLRAAGPARSSMLVRLHERQLGDQLAALAYLKSLPFVSEGRLIAMGGSFGGIQTMLAAAQSTGYRAAIRLLGCRPDLGRLPGHAGSIDPCGAQCGGAYLALASQERLTTMT